MHISERRVFRHTKKAIKYGNPSDRIFIEVGVWSDPDTSKKYILAWKCEMLASSKRLKCPWTKATLTVADAVKSAPKDKADNGAMPTAIFTNDSLYELVSYNPSAELDSEYDEYIRLKNKFEMDI